MEDGFNMEKPSQMAYIAAGLAAASLIFEVLTCCCGVFGLIAIPAGLAAGVLGFFEFQKIGRQESSEKGKPFAIAGMVAGALCLLYIVALIVLFVLYGASIMGAGLMEHLKNR